MNVSLRLQLLVPEAEYFGVPTDKASYDALIWNDGRAKPSWSKITSAATAAAEADYLEKAAAADLLSRTDKEMARVSEDVIAALVARGLIAMEDLPKQAVDKMAARDLARGVLNG